MFTNFLSRRNSFHAVVLLAGASVLHGQQREAPVTQIPELVMRDRLITKVTPFVPLQLKEQGISGTVVLQVLVGEDGRVESATVVSGPEALRTSYVDAVKRWAYSPFLLQGRKVRVMTTVTLVLNKGMASEPFQQMRAGACGNGDCSSYRPQQPESRVRVSSGVMAGQATYKPMPVFPAEAREQHINGSVVMRVVVGRDGKVLQVTPISGPEVLRKPYADAVRQWQYRPFLLNGQAVEVDTVVTIDISMGGQAIRGPYVS